MVWPEVSFLGAIGPSCSIWRQVEGLMWRCLKCKQDNANGLTECWNCLHEREEPQPEPMGQTSRKGLDSDDMLLVESVLRNRKPNRSLDDIAADFVCLKCGSVGAQFDYLALPKKDSGHRKMVSFTCNNCGYSDLYDPLLFNEGAYLDS